jgi:hypothetical protein
MAPATRQLNNQQLDNNLFGTATNQQQNELPET